MADLLDANKILLNLDLKDDMLACEFGCGSGNFAISLAKKLKKGKVYGLDVQEEKLSALKGRASLEKLKNVFTVHCNLEREIGSTFKKNYVDIVLIPNVLFQAEDKRAIIKEAERILKKDGQLLIIDWAKTVKPEEVRKICEELNLKLKKEFSASEYQFALLFVK